MKLCLLLPEEGMCMLLTCHPTRKKAMHVSLPKHPTLVFHLSPSQKIKLAQPVRKGSTIEHLSKPKGRSPDISYFHVFGCPVHIHNHKDHLVKFNAKADDGFFLSYSLVAKAFRVFNIRRHEMEETCHVIFSEDDEAISKSSTEGDEINFNENRSLPDDEFFIPRNKVSQCSCNDYYFSYVPAHDHLSTNNISIPDNVTPSETPIHQDSNPSDEHPDFTIADDRLVINEHDDFESVEDLGIVEDQVSTIIEPVNNIKPSTTITSPSAEVFINPPIS
ncbi:hypothetical protein Tco_0375174 [Tanacetum coccineum]